MPAISTSDLRAALREVGELIITTMKAILAQDRYPLTKGNLINSLKAQVGQARDRRGRFTATAELTILMADYGVYLDRGRRPGARKVPLEALIRWIKEKRIGVGRTSRGRFTARTVSVNQLAYIIRESIYRKGIRGRNYIQPAFDAGGRLLEAYLDNSYLDGVTADVDAFFSTR